MFCGHLSPSICVNFQLLKGTCFQCHRFNMLPAQGLLLKFQIKCLDLGLLTLVQEMQLRCNAMVAEGGDQSWTTVHEELEPQLEEMFEQAKQGWLLISLGF